MFKITLKVICLGLLVSLSLPTTSKAAGNVDHVGIVLGGSASGWALAKVWHKMEAKGLPTSVKVPTIVVMASLAYCIRTQLIPTPKGNPDALGLLGALCSFWYTV